MRFQRILVGVSVIVFVASAAMTIAASVSMAAMGEMRMPGGWTMSHMWMGMPGQSWSGATASFVAMWSVMMVAMMMPSLTPSLLSYRDSLGRRIGSARAGLLTAIVAFAYFAVWACLGAVVFSLGAALVDLAMQDPSAARAVPFVTGLAVTVAGLIQLVEWKAQYEASCRETSSVSSPARVNLTTAWNHGLYLGVHCVRSCAGITLIALCLGVMDVAVMAVVVVTLTAERRWHVVGRALA